VLTASARCHHGAVSNEGRTSGPPRGRRVLRGVVIGIAAVGLAAVGAIVFPRTAERMGPAADVAAQAEKAAREVGFVPSVPSGLPEGWTVTSAKVRRTSRDRAVWHVGMRSADGHFVGLDQVVGADSRWIQGQVSSGPETGTREVGRRSWILRERVERGTVGLVHAGPRVTTVVTGHARPDEMPIALAAAETLASALDLPDTQP
jgi:small ligand-binding sensory domain FIST